MAAGLLPTMLCPRACRTREKGVISLWSAGQRRPPGAVLGSFVPRARSRNAEETLRFEHAPTAVRRATSTKQRTSVALRAVLALSVVVATIPPYEFPVVATAFAAGVNIIGAAVTIMLRGTPGRTSMPRHRATSTKLSGARLAPSLIEKRPE